MADFGTDKRYKKGALCAVLPLSGAAISPPHPTWVLKFLKILKTTAILESFFLILGSFKTKHNYLQDLGKRPRKLKIICACAENHNFRERKASVRHPMIMSI